MLNAKFQIDLKQQMLFIMMKVFYLAFYQSYNLGLIIKVFKIALDFISISSQTYFPTF